MDGRAFVNLLGPLAVAVLAGGWALAVEAFFVVGTETCTQVSLPVAGSVEACQDTTPNAVILLTVIGFGATIGALFFWALRHLMGLLADIADNTRPPRL
jgi:hypothetical protein